MSRSGYVEDCDHLNLWRGTVARAIRGKRGQAFLREMAAALDAMPVKRLVAGDLVSEEGCCAMGSVAVARRQDVSEIDASEPDDVAAAFGISAAMAREIAYINDDDDQTPEVRWQRVRRWVADQIRSQS